MTNHQGNNTRRTFKPKAGLDFSISMEGKMPPSGLELEGAVLGAIMLEGQVADSVMQDMSEQLFYSNSHQLICRAILAMYKGDEKIDILTVTVKLKENGDLEDAGGPYYVTQLTNRVSSASNTEFHVKLLQQFALRREMIKLGSLAIKDSYDDNLDVFDMYSSIQSQMEASINNVLKYQVQSIGAWHTKSIKEYLKKQKEGGPSGVTCGLTAVDKTTSGWQKSDLIIIAGRPGMGKTALALTLALHPAIENNEPVGFFSIEMSTMQLLGRAQSALSGLPSGKIIRQQLNEDEIFHLGDSCKKLERAPLYIDDTPALSLIELKTKSRKLVREHGVKMIVIDYLQLMRSGIETYSREQEVSDISRGLKALAKELDIPIIALSQLSRATEARGEKKPMLSDLRESGAIEQDADMVGFCYRPEYYGFSEDYELDGQYLNPKGLFLLLIEKHRNGPTGEIPLMFHHEQTRVSNYNDDKSYLPPVNQQGVGVSSPTFSDALKSDTSFLNTNAPPPF